MPRKHNTPRRNLPLSPLDKAKAYEVIWQEVAPVFDAARPYGNASFVYVIAEEGGPLKIGFSKDPVGRLRNMQTGNPRRLRIERVLFGAMATEKLLHQFWESFAILSAKSKGTPGAAPGTEWFKPEARADLMPIMDVSAWRQVELLGRHDDPPSFSELEGIVRDAHAASGYVPHVYQPTVQLAQGVGYVVSRRQRI